jgi:hypothetical protein
MKFTASITHRFKDSPKERLGILNATDKIGGKEGLTLASYLYVLVRSATEFALDCGISTDEANKALDDFREAVKEVKITEE